MLTTVPSARQDRQAAGHLLRDDRPPVHDVEVPRPRTRQRVVGDRLEQPVRHGSRTAPARPTPVRRPAAGRRRGRRATAAGAPLGGHRRRGQRLHQRPDARLPRQHPDRDVQLADHVREPAVGAERQVPRTLPGGSDRRDRRPRPAGRPHGGSGGSRRCPGRPPARTRRSGRGRRSARAATPAGPRRDPTRRARAPAPGRASRTRRPRRAAARRACPRSSWRRAACAPSASSTRWHGSAPPDGTVARCTSVVADDVERADRAVRLLVRPRTGPCRAARGSSATASRRPAARCSAHPSRGRGRPARSPPRARRASPHRRRDRYRSTGVSAARSRPGAYGRRPDAGPRTSAGLRRVPATDLRTSAPTADVRGVARPGDRMCGRCGQAGCGAIPPGR